jgi:hypothetical protein
MRSDQQAQAAGSLPVHSLYVGSRDGRAFPDAERQAVIEASDEAEFRNRFRTEASSEDES